MAELVGLVASSIALAEVVGKVGGGILRLKRMWDEVKDVPEAIQDLFKRLDLVLPMVARIARDIESGETVLQDVEAVEGCILSCQQVIADEAAMLEDLIIQIDSTKRLQRLRDMVRVALKKDVLARHEKKLEGMFQALMLAHAEYSRAYTKAMPTIIVQQLSASGYVVRQEENQEDKSTETLVKTAANNKSVGGRVSGNIAARNTSFELPLKGQSFLGSFTSATRSSQIGLGSSQWETTEHGFRIQLPWWMTQRAWEMRVLSGWQCYFRTYNIVPDGVFDQAPVFQCIDSYDLKGLLELFEQGKASPFDVGESGVTVFKRALNMGNTEILKALVRLGCHTSHGDLYKASAGYYNTIKLHHCSAKQKLHAFEKYHEFITTQGIWDLEGEMSMDLTRWLVKAATSHVVSLRTLLPRVSPNHHTKRIIDRLKVIQYATDGIREDIFSLILWPDGFRSPGDISELQSQGCSLLHIVTHLSFRRDLEEDFYQFQYDCEGENKDNMSKLWRNWLKSQGRVPEHHDWKRRRREVIKATAALSFRNVGTAAPLNCSSIGCRNPFATLLLTVLNSCRWTYGRWATSTIVHYSDRRRRWYSLPPKDKVLEIMSKSWLEDLACSNVDLESYGREELALLKMANLNRHNQYGPLRHRGENRRGWPLTKVSTASSDKFRFPRLEKLKFGPRPSDWGFTWDWEVEDFAGEFWAAIETPVHAIPGAWVEEYDDRPYWGPDAFDQFLPEAEVRQIW